MKKITVSEKIKAVCPHLQIGVLSASIINSLPDERLWEEIEAFAAGFRSRYRIEDINKRPAIRCTRETYKATGKDPNRYRPAAESLCRRIVRGLPLYKVNTAVDLINLVSLHTGYSIGGFDENKIQGELVLGIGTEGETYRGIGRGELNIAGLPVYRDAISGIGTPTSDEERTKIGLDTTRLLMIINAYSGTEGLDEAISFAATLLKKYVSAHALTCQRIEEGKTTDFLLNKD